MNSLRFWTGEWTRAAAVLVAWAAGAPAARSACEPSQLVIGTSSASAGGSAAVDVLGGVSCEVTGFSLAMGYDNAILSFAGAEPGDFLVAHAGDQLFFHQAGHDTEGFAVVGAILDLSFPLTVPPVAIPKDTVLARVRFEVAATAPPGTIPLLNRTRTFGAGNPIANVYSGKPGEPPVEPTLVDGAVTVAEPIDFLRGDGNGDGRIDISDPVFILNYLFTGGSRPPCQGGADANDGDELDIADPIYLLGYLFFASPPPQEPFPVCGMDPTPGRLSCETYAKCP